MADFSMPFPPELTKAQWEHNKGVMAKLFVGKTDIGGALAAVELEFNRWGFGSIKGFDGADPVDFLAYKKGLVEGLTKGEAAIGNKLGALKVIATAAHADFAKSKTVPKSATTYVKGILDAITTFKADLAKFPEKAGDDVAKAYRDRLHKTPEYMVTTASAKSASNLVIQIINMVKGIESRPTVANVHAAFKEDGPHRLLTTMFKTWDQIVRVKCPKLAASIYTGHAMSDYFNLPHLEDVADEMSSKASHKLALKVNGGLDEARVVHAFLLEYSKSVVESQKMLKHFIDAAKVMAAI